MLYPTQIGLLLPTTMSSVIGNHRPVDRFFLLIERELKNLLFNLLITERSFKNLSYLSSCLFSRRWRFRRIRSNVSQGIESDTACRKVSGVSPSTFYGLETCG